MSTAVPPSTIAREAFKQLATRRIAPTPENYARAYAEQANVTLAEVQPALSVLEALGREIATDPTRAGVGRQIVDALGRADWNRLREALKRASTPAPAAPQPQAPVPVAAATADKALVRRADGSTLAPEDRDLPPLPGHAASESEAVRAVKVLFGRTIEELVAERLGYSTRVVDEARALVGLVQQAHTRQQLEDATGKLKQFWLRLELRNEGPEPLVKALHGLLRLIVRNIGDLMSEDKWFQTQVAKVEGLLDQPLTTKTLAETEKCFKEFAYRQDWLKLSLDEAKGAIRDMMTVFVDRLATMSASTGDYSERLADYVERIHRTEDMKQISVVIQQLVGDTETMKGGISRASGELAEARARVQAAESRVHELESELEKVAELVREDPLTQTLNRRGLDMQYGIEEARARRKSVPMALAIIDLDNFKRLNDQHGHQAGDAALRHVTQVLKRVIRPTDTLARYGGEEFVVLLPETSLAAAETAMVRVQKELARHALHWDANEIHVTFSCGVAERRADETQESMIERADAALLVAKQSGKNMVVPAA